MLLPRYVLRIGCQPLKISDDLGCFVPTCREQSHSTFYVRVVSIMIGEVYPRSVYLLRINRMRGMLVAVISEVPVICEYVVRLSFEDPFV
jgi:hypothetical protein